ncbi:MAG: ParB N-terminal domain-containing protein, partial [Rikenellaceae bacterium]
MSKQMKGLGKGLDAIFQNSGVSPVAGRSPIRTNDSTVKEISLDRIKPNPNQPRTLFSDESIDELAVSIGRLGIIQPVTLRE